MPAPTYTARGTSPAQGIGLPGRGPGLSLLASASQASPASGSLTGGPTGLGRFLGGGTPGGSFGLAGLFGGGQMGLPVNQVYDPQEMFMRMMGGGQMGQGQGQRQSQDPMQMALMRLLFGAGMPV